MILFACGRARAGERLEAETARAALANVLERAPFLPPSAVRTWLAPSGRAAVVWAGEGVHEGDEEIALFSGRPYRWTAAERADGREPLAPEGYLRDPAEWAPALDGRWAAAAYDERAGTLRVAADALGAHPVHVRETANGRWYGNVPDVLAALDPRSAGPASEAPLAGLLGGGWPLSGDAWWPEVRRLPRGEVHTDDGARSAERVETLPLERLAALPGAGSDPEAAARILVAALGALADWPGRESIVPVTGGRDSRVILAGALRAGFPFTCMTGGSPETGDVVAGRALSAAAGVAHARLGPSPGGDPWSSPERAGRVVGALTAGTASLGDGAGFPLAARDGAAPLWHTGQGGEVGRAYYGTGSGDAGALVVQLERAFTGRRPGRSAPLSPAGEAAIEGELRAWIEAVLAAGARAADVPDLFYLLRRMGTWAGPPHAMVASQHEATSALWSRRLVPHLLGASPAERAGETLHRRLVEILAPELVDVPFADGAGWEGPNRLERGRALLRRRGGQALAEARRRTRRRAPAPALLAEPGTEHAFARPLAAIRAAAAAQPDHPAWAVLDRARAEALLAARPEDLDWMGQAYVWRLGTVFLAAG